MINNIQSTAFRQFLPKQNAINIKKKDTKNNVKLNALLGTAAGTLVPLGLMLKGKKIKNPLKMEYNLKDMLILSATSIAGGTLGGMTGENKESKIKKLKEGTFQFLNAALPTLGVAGGLKLCTKHRALNSAPFKILSVMLGISAGMFGALKLSNFIFDPKNKHSDRKLSPKDCLASADEAIGALALAKFPLVQNLHLDKALPLIYGYCGYRAGAS